MKAHETLLREECNYTGYQPYWDEKRDADHSSDVGDSTVFDPETGFGGEGGDCVTDGPFVNITLRLSEDWGVVSSSDYCLSRSFNNQGFQGASSTYVDACMAAQKFTTADECLRSDPHTAGHAGVGGTMLDAVCYIGTSLSTLLPGSSSIVQDLLSNENTERLTGRSTFLPPSHQLRSTLVELAAGLTRGPYVRHR